MEACPVCGPLLSLRKQKLLGYRWGRHHHRAGTKAVLAGTASRMASEVSRPRWPKKGNANVGMYLLPDFLDPICLLFSHGRLLHTPKSRRLPTQLLSVV